MKQELEVYARFKPKQSKYQISTTVLENKQVLIQLDRTQKHRGISNTNQKIQFNFNQVFGQQSSQQEVFQAVANPVLQNCLEGYNGTIFAYGQTGSGKTHTISGAESWSQRGIIPRVLTQLFDEFEARKDIKFNMYISFMEIYNENAYDLLEKHHLESPIENWNKITLFEDDYGHLHLRNLSVHQINNEQEGIDLLMMGNFIRQVSSTPMNQCSSRSHCIFTITLEGNSLVNEVGFVSKLHLVDLAGSERIGKTHVEGSTLNEAKYINLSLSYLEQVIIALQERSQGVRSHIPYRNSLLTTILKDSLGGNCRTTMIATMSSDVNNLEETISTARFAQRCAQLENEITKNQKIDLQMLVQRLEIEKNQLLNELQQYRNNGRFEKQQLLMNQNEEFDQAELVQVVDDYLNEKVDQVEFKSIEQANMIFKTMKELYNTRMKEYVTELTFISEKLQKYDEIIFKKKTEIQNNKLVHIDNIPNNQIELEQDEKQIVPDSDHQIRIDSNDQLTNEQLKKQDEKPKSKGKNIMKTLEKMQKQTEKQRQLVKQQQLAKLQEQLQEQQINNIKINSQSIQLLQQLQKQQKKQLKEQQEEQEEQSQNNEFISCYQNMQLSNQYS